MNQKIQEGKWRASSSLSDCLFSHTSSPQRRQEVEEDDLSGMKREEGTLTRPDTMEKQNKKLLIMHLLWGKCPILSAISLRRLKQTVADQKCTCVNFSIQRFITTRNSQGQLKQHTEVTQSTADKGALSKVRL